MGLQHRLWVQATAVPDTVGDPVHCVAARAEAAHVFERLIGSNPGETTQNRRQQTAEATGQRSADPELLVVGAEFGPEYVAESPPWFGVWLQTPKSAYSSSVSETNTGGLNPLTINHTAKTISCNASGTFNRFWVVENGSRPYSTITLADR